MGKHSPVTLIIKAAKDFLNNPILAFPPLMAFLLLVLLSYLSQIISLNISSNAGQIIWLFLYSIISLIFLSFSFTVLLFLALSLSKANHPKPYKILLSDSIIRAKSVWHRNFLNMILIALSSMVLVLLANFIGRMASLLGYSFAIIIFILVMFSGLAGGIIFLTFSTSYAVINGSPVLESIIFSARLVKTRYIEVLSIIIFFLVLYKLISFIPNVFFVEIIQSLIIAPILSLVLVRFVLSSGGANVLPAQR